MLVFERPPRGSRTAFHPPVSETGSDARHGMGRAVAAFLLRCRIGAWLIRSPGHLVAWRMRRSAHRGSGNRRFGAWGAQSGRNLRSFAWHCKARWPSHQCHRKRVNSNSTALPLAQQAQQQVLGAEVAVPQQAGLTELLVRRLGGCR
jgi:hypothetical protein